MNTLFTQDRIFRQIEQCLTVIAAFIIAAAPVYGLWALNAMPLVSPV
jgi:hypothetical protein